MERFAQLIDALDGSSGSKRKVELLSSYLADVLPEDGSWALTLLLRVEDMLAERYRSTRREALFEALRPSLREVDATLDYDRLAGELDMTRGALRVAVHRLRSRYAALLRDEVLLLVSGAEDVDRELVELLDAIRP